MDSIGGAGDGGGRCLVLTRTGVSSASPTVTVDFPFLFFLCESMDATRGRSEGPMEPAGVVDSWDEFGVTYVGSGGAPGDGGGRCLDRTGVSSDSSTMTCMTVDFLFLFFLVESLGETEGGPGGLIIGET